MADTNTFTLTSIISQATDTTTAPAADVTFLWDNKKDRLRENKRPTDEKYLLNARSKTHGFEKLAL